MIKNNIKFLILIIILANANCDKFSNFEKGKPEEIVEKAEKFYKEKNAEKFVKLYSERALKKLDRSLQALRMQFKTLDPQYRQDLAEKMNMDPNSLANLKMTDFILFNMNNKSGGMGSDNIIFPVDEVPKTEYVDTKIDNDQAQVKFERIIIYLVKEKELWKIDTFKYTDKHISSLDMPPSEDQ